MRDKLYMSFYGPKETKRRLSQMAEADHRNLSQQVCWLIDQEWDRRQQPRVLIDTPALYRTEPGAS